MILLLTEMLEEGGEVKEGYWGCEKVEMEEPGHKVGWDIHSLQESRRR